MMLSSPSGIHLHFHNQVTIQMFAAPQQPQDPEVKQIEAGMGVLSPLEATRALPPTHPNNMGERQRGQWLVKDQDWFKAKYPDAETAEEDDAKPDEPNPEAHRWAGWFPRRRVAVAASE